MIRYVFRDAPLIVNNVENAEPQIIGEELERLTAANQGQLTPELVLKAATSKKHRLHQFFEWDDSKAANAFRLQQARMLIRAVAIEGEEEAEPVPAFLSVSDKGGRSYRSHEEIMESPRLQKLILEAAKRDLVNYRQRYRRLAELFEPALSEAINRLSEAAENNDLPV